MSAKFISELETGIHEQHLDIITWNENVWQREGKCPPNMKYSFHSQRPPPLRGDVFAFKRK